MKRTTLIALLTLCYLGAKAQDVAIPNIFYDNMNALNPAMTLSDTTRNNYATLYTTYHWVHSELYAEQPFDITATYQRRLQHGAIAAGYSYDGYSFHNRHTIYAGYAYAWRLAPQHTLGIGANLLLNFDAMRWEALDLPSNMPNNLYVAPDADLGIYYGYKGLRVGFSVKNLIGTSSKLNNTVLLRNRRTYITSLSYDFALKGNATLSPLLLMRFDGEVGFDVGIHSSFLSYLRASYLFRIKQLRHVVSIGGVMPCGVTLDASFDLSHTVKEQTLQVRLGYLF